MNNGMAKRLVSLESIIKKKRQRQEEAARELYAKIKYNAATVWHKRKLTLAADTTYDIIEQLEDYILQAKPEKVTISAEMTGFIEFIPGAEEYEEWRDIDTWYSVPTGTITGDYYSLLASNENITLANIMMCELLIPWVGSCKMDEDVGIEHIFERQSGMLYLSDRMDLIGYVLVDRVRKYKAYKAAHINSPDHSTKAQAERINPSNKWSKYWSGEGGYYEGI